MRGNTVAGNYDIFKRYLKDRRIAYTEIDEEMLMIAYRGEEKESIPLICTLDSGAPDKALLCCFDIADCSGEEAAGLLACNRVSQVAPGVSIYLDEDSRLSAMSTVRVHREYFCEDIIEAMNYLSEAVDAVYMQFHEETENNQ